MTARQVVLEGGAPWGFRMHGGKDHSQLLRISRVNPGSKAALRGVREGDLISSLNGQSTKDLTNAEAHALLKRSGNTLYLDLNEDTDGSPIRRQYTTIHQETVQETIERSSTTSYTIKKTLQTSESEKEHYNEKSCPKNNESYILNGTSKTSTTPSNRIVTQRSPLPSTTSSSSSSSTIVKEDFSRNISTDNAEACSQRSSYTNCTLSPTNTLFSEDGVWSPGQKQEFSDKEQVDRDQQNHKSSQNEPISPVWTPKSASSSPTVERKEFRPVNFQSPILTRRNRTQSENFEVESRSLGIPWKTSDYSSIASSTSFLEKRLPTSHSSPISGFNNLSNSPRLPKAQNPTITLLQKAREGHLPKGPVYIEQDQRVFTPKNDRPPIANPGEILYQIKTEYTSESESEKPRKMADLSPRKYEGIGPVSKDGMPLILRSEIKDQNQSKWYKRMYDTIHKQKAHNDEYVTVRYKQRRAHYPYSSGYLSEPEPGAYDSDFTEYKYQTLDRRRPPMQDYSTSTMPRNTTIRTSSSDLLREHRDTYKGQPGRIENYIPGCSSISDKEAKQWWDEVMDIFDGHLEQQKKVTSHPRSFMNQALKESGYESDSTLVFRRKEDAANQLTPKDQREAYKVIQKGGDVPLHGLRKPAPERPKESPRKYVENEVTIHYKTPVRQEIKNYLSEDELAYRQAEAMKKIYQEERRKKYLQELQDINSRRHTDNFTPTQKSPISLNRYDDFEDLAPAVKPRPRSPEPRLVARALYNFVGQTARELTFRKGDLIYVRRQVDKNWYEGELNAMIGLFPTNYVEIVPYDGMKTTPRKAHEGQGRAKYNFLAQTHLELSLAKGELVVITKRIDDNWLEGKIGGKKGIFPASYVEILIDPQEAPLVQASKPVAAPAAHSLLLNGSSGGKDSMGSHSYAPNLPVQLTSSFQSKPSGSGSTISSGYGSLQKKSSVAPPLNQTLHIETESEPIPYRALYKYNPQNDDELELLEGDTVYVLETCDDGWFVGSSNRTGAFGTFPGNYVEKI